MADSFPGDGGGSLGNAGLGVGSGNEVARRSLKYLRGPSPLYQNGVFGKSGSFLKCDFAGTTGIASGLRVIWE
jgi:hypothetical protein